MVTVIERDGCAGDSLVNGARQQLLPDALAGKQYNAIGDGQPGAGASVSSYSGLR